MASSETLVPKPPDWGADDHITGYWFSEFDARWSPPTDLADFLAAGPPPVYVGFGCMVPGSPAARTAVIVDALHLARLRGVLDPGWGGLKPTRPAPHVHYVSDIPHEWLFPRVRAVIHHGGSGTTRTGLRHGRPTLICPLFGDQPFWGRRCAELGAGPAPWPLAKLQVDQLARALMELVSNGEYALNARDIQAGIGAEDQAKAVHVVDAQMRDRPRH